jgi:hypothetical protein
VYAIEVVLLIECEISSLKISIELLPNMSIEKEHLLHLMQLDETRHDATLVIEDPEETRNIPIRQACQAVCFL